MTQPLVLPGLVADFSSGIRAVSKNGRKNMRLNAPRHGSRKRARTGSAPLDDRVSLRKARVDQEKIDDGERASFVEPEPLHLRLDQLGQTVVIHRLENFSCRGFVSQDNIGA